MNLLKIILSSSVLVGVIGYIKWNQRKKLERITDESKKWRDDIRCIAEKLADANSDKEIII